MDIVNEFVLKLLRLDYIDTSNSYGVLSPQSLGIASDEEHFKFLNVLYSPASHENTSKEVPRRPMRLNELFYCENCNKVLSLEATDIIEEVESYYCPHTLENMPSAEAIEYNYKGSRAFSCPDCFAMLTIMSSSSFGDGEKFFFLCSHCRWDSIAIDLIASNPTELTEVGIKRESNQSMEAVFDSIVDFYNNYNNIEWEKRKGNELPPIRQGGIWRWEHIDQNIKKRMEKSLAVPRKSAPGIQYSDSYIPVEERTTVDQQLNSPTFQPQRLAEIYPQRLPLRIKRSVRCRGCLYRGLPNILLKAHINPLKGDSSLRTNVGNWFMKRSLAWDNLPRIISFFKNDPTPVIYLLMTNPFEHDVSIQLSTSSGHIKGEDIVNKQTWSFTIQAYDELVELDSAGEIPKLDERIQADECNVIGKWQNKVVLSLGNTRLMPRGQVEQADFDAVVQALEEPEKVRDFKFSLILKD